MADTKTKNIFSEIRDIINDFEQGNVEKIDGLLHSQHDIIRTIEFYSDSKYLGGQKDELGRDKPYYQILNAGVDTAYTATEQDTKDFEVVADNDSDWARSFLIRKVVEKWKKIARYGKSLNRQAERRARYGGVLVKKTYDEDGNLRIEPIVWKNMVTDQANIKKGPKIDTHYMSAVDLSKKRGIWNDTAIEAAIKLATEGRKKKGRPRGTIMVREIEAELPQSYMEEGANQYDYSLQLHFVCMDDGEELELYKEELSESQYKYLPWNERSGLPDALGVGVMEEGFEAQVWTNDAAIKEQRWFELASKAVLQSASKRLKNRNILKEVDNGTILEHDENKPITAVNLVGSAAIEFKNLTDKWWSQYERVGALYDAVRGETPPSGQPFRLQAMVQAQGSSTFKQRKEEMGEFQDEIFNDWIIPDVIEQYKRGKILASEFTQDELEALDNDFANFLVWEKLKPIQASIPLEVDIEDWVNTQKQQILTQLRRQRNHRHIEIPKGYFNGWKGTLSILSTDEQKNKEALMESFSNILTLVAKSFNPQTGKFMLLQDKVLAQIFGKLVEMAGIGLSPIMLGIGRDNEQSKPSQPVIPAMQPQQQPQPGQEQPAPEMPMQPDPMAALMNNNQPTQ